MLKKNSHDQTGIRTTARNIEMKVGRSILFTIRTPKEKASNKLIIHIDRDKM
jgi:hypothetical protein